MSATKGPRSLMRTCVCLPLRRFVTRTTALKGSVRCAAVNSCMSYVSPLEVRRPLNGTPYHEATPSSTYSPGTTGRLSVAGGGPERGEGPAGAIWDCDAGDEAEEGVCAGEWAALWRFTHPARIAATSTDAPSSDKDLTCAGENRNRFFNGK